MTLPTFLGIGTPRSATTWLSDLLSTHPDVFVPTRRKEVHYFNANFERGPTWYSAFFPPDTESASFRAIGEFTPIYMFDPLCLERIAGYPDIRRFLVMFRDPVERFWSEVEQRCRVTRFSGPLDEFLVTYPDVMASSRYAAALEKYLTRFGRDAVLVLISERAVSDVSATKRTLGEFLDVDPGKFPAEAGALPVNVTVRPRSSLLSSTLTRVARSLRHHDLDVLVNLAKRIGGGLVGSPVQPAPGSSRTLADPEDRVARELAPEIAALEELLGAAVPEWHAQG